MVGPALFLFTRIEAREIEILYNTKSASAREREREREGAVGKGAQASASVDYSSFFSVFRPIPQCARLHVCVCVCVVSGFLEVAAIVSVPDAYAYLCFLYPLLRLCSASASAATSASGGDICTRTHLFNVFS